MKNTTLLLLIGLSAVSCSQMNQDEKKMEADLRLSWEFLGNDESGGYHSAVFILENRGKEPLGEQGWSIFFNQMGMGVIRESVTGNVKIDHINGDWLRLSPEPGFMLEAGKEAVIGYDKPGWLIKECQAPEGPYVVMRNQETGKDQVLAIADYTVLPFPPLGTIFPESSGIPLPDAGWVYAQNREITFQEPGEEGKIIPGPLSEKYLGEMITIGSGWTIRFEEELHREADHLKMLLDQVMESSPPVEPGEKEGSSVIRLTTTPDLSTEAYELRATPEGGIVISGGDAAGVFYGVQSLAAMVPPEAWIRPGSTLQIEAASLSDRPAFGYRGFHLDIARNFIEPASIKKLIQIMSFYKLNKLHLHLTDDEGWRLEIPAFPELTDIGGFRGHTDDSKDHLIPAYGSGPFPDPEKSHGSGYLTRDSFIEILLFARDHHVEVIPEINFPGHARAAIHAMEARYDSLMEAGLEQEAWEYRLIDPNDQSEYNSAQNYDDNVVCVCQEGPYRFFETVLDEILAMYEEAGLTLEMIHTGGDEVPAGVWTKSPVCAGFLEENPRLGGTDNLQAYFGSRIFEMLREKGLLMGGWEEVAMLKDPGGRWIPNPEFAGRGMIPYVWNSILENLDLGYRLANAGYRVVLCNVTNFYFDLAYNHHPAEPGLYWGGLVDTRDAFQFAPYDVYKTTLADMYGNLYNPEVAFAGMERLNPASGENIIGLQAQLWSETIRGGTMAEYYYMPKMVGFAERAWSGQASWGEIEEPEDRMKAMQQDWNRFANLVGQREMPRLDAIYGGFNYRLPPPGAVIMDGKLHANVDFPGLTIRYSTDGNEPEPASPVYDGPVEVEGTVMLRTFDTRGRGSRISTVMAE